LGVSKEEYSSINTNKNDIELNCTELNFAKKNAQKVNLLISLFLSIFSMDSFQTPTVVAYIQNQLDPLPQLFCLT